MIHCHESFDSSWGGFGGRSLAPGLMSTASNRLGSWPTGIVATTFLVLVSIAETVSSS